MRYLLKVTISLFILSLSMGCQKAVSSNSNESSLIVEEEGYAGPIRVQVRFSSDNKITEVKVLSHQETSTYVKEDPLSKFAKQFKGLDASKRVGDIDTISGATITSNAIQKAVEQACQEFAGRKGKSRKKSLTILRAIRKAGLSPRRARYWKRLKDKTK